MRNDVVPKPPPQKDAAATKQNYFLKNRISALPVSWYNTNLWFVLREGVYELLEPDKNGILRSKIFSGLWLQPAALWSGDLAALLATLQQGLASPEHTTFVEQLTARRQEKRSPS